MVFLFSYLEGMKRDISDNLHTYYSGEIQVRNRDYGKYEYLNPLHLRIESYEEVLREISRNEEVDVISPRIIFSKVVFPHPLGPTNTINSPCSTRQLTLSIT